MDKLINFCDGKVYKLVATAVDDNLDFYTASSLEDVCLFYDQSIRKTKSPVCKALERSRYAEFMIHHVMSFESGICRKRLEQIISLCESAIATLNDPEKCDKTFYDSTIKLCKRNSCMAAELLTIL